MARIFDEWLSAVAYMYPSEQAALDGDHLGGSGMVIHVAASTDQPIRYVLTNAHIATGGGRYVRLNRSDGTTGVVDIDPSTWHYGTPDDIAVAPLPLDTPAAWDVEGVVWHEWALTRDEVVSEAIGPGDEVVMLGRLLSYDGKLTNQPTVRFGNIAMMPGEPIRDGQGREVEVFLADMRSQSGFSGSGVFLVINMMEPRPDRDSVSPGVTLFFLGVDTGHTRMKTSVFVRTEQGFAKSEALFVQENSGIALVAPAWKVTELLNADDSVAMRESLAEDPRYCAQPSIAK